MLLQRDHTYYMQQALKEAQTAFDKEEIPVGAVIVAGDTIIARAHNLTELLQDVTAHAEMQAFTAAANYLGGKYLKDCTLYVTLEPCAMCAGASQWAQISTVVYGAADPNKKFDNSQLYHPKTNIIGGVLEQECADLMKRFFSRKRV